MSVRIAILHYSVSPVVGGVETVIQAHARYLIRAGYQVTIVAGRGESQALPEGAQLELIPEMDSRHPAILQASHELEQGKVSTQFEPLTDRLELTMAPILESMDHVIVHNVFTKHFNLALTTALFRLLDKGSLHGCIAWCHDFTWTSPHSRSNVHPGYPWDYLRTYHPNITYVTVSRARQQELAGLMEVPADAIQVVYNGVEPQELLALSQPGEALIQRLGLWESDLVLLMPVRVTQAKNIEFAFQVIAALKQRSIHPTLVISGPPDPHDALNMEYYQELQKLRLQSNLEQEVRFVYDSGPENDHAFEIGFDILSELYRVSDLLFMPSRREGFGMPILEAGLVGLPVFCANVPAAAEIGGKQVITFPLEASPEEVAGRILTWAEGSRQLRLRRRIRKEYTWRAIVDRDLLPLLKQSEAA